MVIGHAVVISGKVDMQWLLVVKWTQWLLVVSTGYYTSEAKVLSSRWNELQHESRV